MANDSEKYIQGAILQGGGIPQGKTNVPKKYVDRQGQYLAIRTQQFTEARAKYSSDFVEAQVQGLLEDFYEWTTTYIRLSDIRSNSSVTTQIDDYKTVLFEDKEIEYFPIGAKVETMGNIWICANPSNISGAQATAIIRRCNSSFNYYDYYGNIKTEPLVIDKVAMQGNDNVAPSDQVLLNGYFNAMCQLNEVTKRELNTDRIIILGSKAFKVTGFTDFIQEFTGDYDSSHVLNFSLRIQEPTENDDIENRIAGGKLRSFKADIIGESELNQNSTTKLAAVFIKDDKAVEPTDEYPVTWLWESSDTDIAEVDADGVVLGKGGGNVQITARMAQNTAISATAELVVKETNFKPYVAFMSVVPSAVEQYESITVTAAYFENAQQTDKVVSWSFSGANKKNYKATIDDNALTIYCIGADNTPLKVTAECEGQFISFELILEGL